MIPSLSLGRSELVRIGKVALHMAMYFIALLFAYELRRALPLEWWWTHPDAARVLGWAFLFAVIGGGVEIVFRTERTAWRFTSLREAITLIRNVVVSLVLLLATIFLLDRGVQMPRSVLPLAGLITLCLLVGQRVVWRTMFDRRLREDLVRGLRPGNADDGRTPLFLVGDMTTANSHLRQLLSDQASPYRPVALLSPNAEEGGMRVHGVPIYALEARRLAFLAELLETRAQTRALVFLDDPIRRLGFTVDDIGRLRRVGHMLLRPQPLVNLHNRQGGADALSEIPLEAFLARDPVDLNLEAVRQLVAGKRCVVTGAGGSIGSEICRQLLALGCSRLVMIDHSEFLLFEIGRELEPIRPEIERCARLANVRDRARIDALLKAEDPDIVFHAAALKHVALVEQNPDEGVLTNVLGTWNVLNAAIAAGADQFVLISTDKAVAPSNVMGASKRVAESLLELVSPGRTRLSAVRFGNVLGSAGSVIPIFRDQIAKGGPVTVTDPEVNRFFMTIPEAVQLVLQASAISAARSDAAPAKFILEMGQPVRIVDLARQMITLSGLRPDHDIQIVFTGLKDGEKMSEALIDDDEQVMPCLDGIMEICVQGQVSDMPADVKAAFLKALEQADAAGALARVWDIIRIATARTMATNIQTDITKLESTS